MYIILLGKHWLKPPPMARHHDDDYELSHNKKSWQGTWCCHWKLTRKTQERPKEEEEDTSPQYVYQPPRIPAGIYLGWEIHEPPGRILLCCVVNAQLSRVQVFVTSWTTALQASLSMGPSRPEYWSGFPCSAPEDRPDPGILVYSALVGRFFTTTAT